MKHAQVILQDPEARLSGEIRASLKRGQPVFVIGISKPNYGAAKKRQIARFLNRSEGLRC